LEARKFERAAFCAPQLEALRAAPVAEVARHEHWTLVTLRGELDLHNAHLVRQALHTECQQGPQQLIVDLAEVTFVDSTAVHALIDARKRLRNWRALLLVRPTPAVARTFGICGLERVVTIQAALPDLTTA
jgi:anti-sigma B factor antagonist